MSTLKSILQMVCIFFVISNPLMAYDFSSNVFKFQTKLAQRGDAVAQYKLGTMYETGTGVNVSIEDALKWYNKASAQNNKDATRRIPYVDIIQSGFNKKKHAAWLKGLKKEANDLDGEAAFLLGLMYKNGTGVKTNLLKAKKLLKIAVKLDVSGADNELIDVKYLITTYNEKIANKKRKQLAKDKAIKKLAQRQLELKNLELKRLEIKKLELENREIEKHLAAEKQRRKAKLRKLSGVTQNTQAKTAVSTVVIEPKPPEEINKIVIKQSVPQVKVINKNEENEPSLPWYETFKQQVNVED